MSRTVDDFTVGGIARFLATVPAEGSVGWAAPAGALARVVGFDLTWWRGVLVVQWLDPSHGQSDGGYSPELFEPHHVQLDIFELLGVGA